MAEIKVEGLPASGDSTITFLYTAKEGVPVLEPGHALGFDQITLSEELPQLPAPEAGQVELRQTNREIILTGSGFRYSFRKQTGLFSALCFGNHTLLTRPMEWNLHRAPLDNDKYINTKWTEAGYDRPTVRVYSVEAKQTAEGAEIACRLGIGALTIKPFVTVEALWTVDGAGHISCRLNGERDTQFAFLPRFGLRMFMPKSFGEVEYYGYGPGESYIDKHRSCRLGVYASPVAEQTEHYLKPQENGSHFGCRWAAVKENGCTLKALSPDSFSINVSRYTQEELAAKKHDYELTPAEETVFCLDYKMSGVGSNSCGPLLLDDYQLREEKFSFRFALLPSCN